MRLLLSGYYGYGNLGDDALLEIIVARLRARFPRVVIDVLSATPEKTAAHLDVIATDRWDRRAIADAIGKADAVLSGGGGLLQSATSIRSVLYYGGILHSAVKARRKAMIFAQSIGPLDALGALAVRRLCRGVARATVRDERSATLLRKLLPKTPVERTADPVFLYEPPAGIDLQAEGLGPQHGPYALVSVRKTPSLRDGVHVIARAIDRLTQEHGVHVAFLPLGGPADAEVSTTVIRACKSAPVLLPECSLDKAAALIAGAKAVIGMRLHALILAARFAVPFLPIPYDPKVAALCDDLAYPLEPLWTPGRPAPTYIRIDELVDRLVEEHDALHGHLLARMDAVRSAAERNFDVLAELLEQS